MDLRWTKQLIDRANARSAGTRGGVERLPVCRYSVGGRSLRWRHRGRGLLFAWDYQEFRARGRFSSLADEPFAEDDGELGLGLEPFARTKAVPAG